MMTEKEYNGYIKDKIINCLWNYIYDGCITYVFVKSIFCNDLGHNIDKICLSVQLKPR